MATNRRGEQLRQETVKVKRQIIEKREELSKKKRE